MNTWCPTVSKIHFKVKRWDAKQHTLKRRKRICNSNSCIDYFKQSIRGIYRIDWIYFYFNFCPRCVISSDQSLSPVWLFAIPQTAAHQASLSSPIPGACLNSCPSSRWCHPAISSVIPFSFRLQSFPTSGSCPMSQFFTSRDQSIGVSASASALPMNIQNWFPLGLPVWISLQSKGLSRVFSNTTVQRHQFLGAQLSLWSNSHIHTWLLENHMFD